MNVFPPLLINEPKLPFTTWQTDFLICVFQEAFAAFHPNPAFVQKFLKPLQIGELAATEPSQDRNKNVRLISTSSKQNSHYSCSSFSVTAQRHHRQSCVCTIDFWGFCLLWKLQFLPNLLTVVVEDLTMCLFHSPPLSPLRQPSYRISTLYVHRQSVRVCSKLGLCSSASTWVTSCCWRSSPGSCYGTGGLTGYWRSCARSCWLLLRWLQHHHLDVKMLLTMSGSVANKP